MKKGKIIETPILPVDVIQHIQSFMSRKEAARTTILSKSWHAAWLTGPTIVLDYRGFSNQGQPFEESVKKTMQRYADSNMKIDSFRLRGPSNDGGAFCLIAKAMEMQVVRSKTFEKVFASSCCSRLKSLTLEKVNIESDVFFTDLASRFPSLKDLIIHHCHGCTKAHISSTSLQTISFKHDHSMESNWAKFDVPNIRKFVYSGVGNLPSIDAGASKKCEEFDITISCQRLYKTHWFRNLKSLLTKFRLSKISLSINIRDYERHFIPEYEAGTKVEAEPIAVENLEIKAQSLLYCALMLRLFGICRPKFVTHYWRTKIKGVYPDMLYRRLMQKPITPNSAIPNKRMFGKFGLKKVNIEVYERFDTEWRPLVLQKPLDVTEIPENKRKIQFELFWD